MNKKLLVTTVAAAAMLLGIQSASAADVEAPVQDSIWYASLFGGVSLMNDVHTEYNDPGPYEIDAITDVGFIVGGAIGTHLSENIRVEVEVAYSKNDVDEIEYQGIEYDGTGSFGVLTFMGNLWYDVPLGETFTPYLGGGVGVAVVDANSVGYTCCEEYDSSEVAFAFQAGAGVKWAFSENVALDIGYRLRGIDGPTFEPGSSGADNKADFMFSHNIIAGVSIGF